MLEAVLYIGTIGLVLGVVIGVASIFLTVEEDPMIGQIVELLPGFNCGACGNPGCQGMAEAVINDGVPLTNCKPGNEKMRRDIQALLDTRVAE
jgi:electron transport complex protein RnfB